jgi:hypothetical protein
MDKRRVGLIVCGQSFGNRPFATAVPNGGQYAAEHLSSQEGVVPDQLQRGLVAFALRQLLVAKPPRVLLNFRRLRYRRRSSRQGARRVVGRIRRGLSEHQSGRNRKQRRCEDRNKDPTGSVHYGIRGRPSPRLNRMVRLRLICPFVVILSLTYRIFRI